MQTAEFNVDDFDQKNQSNLDEKLLVKFFYKTRPDKAETEKQGRPMFKEVVYIDIRVPGNNSGGACRPARSTDIDRFPKHYAAFKNRVEAPVEGTPLTEWPLITRSMVDTFAFMNVKTVEQLADLNDTYATQVMGGLTFKQKAKEYLEYAKELQEIEDKKELTRLNSQLLDQNAEQSKQIKDLTERLDALEKDEPIFGKRSDKTPVKAKTAAKKPAKKKKTTKKKSTAKKK